MILSFATCPVLNNFNRKVSKKTRQIAGAIQATLMQLLRRYDLCDKHGELFDSLGFIRDQKLHFSLDVGSDIGILNGLYYLAAYSNIFLLGWYFHHIKPGHVWNQRVHGNNQPSSMRHHGSRIRKR